MTCMEPSRMHFALRQFSVVATQCWFGWVLMLSGVDKDRKSAVDERRN
jgi:hypothetical protein